MAAHLLDLTFIHHQNAVGMSDGGEAAAMPRWNGSLTLVRERIGANNNQFNRE